MFSMLDLLAILLKSLLQMTEHAPDRGGVGRCRIDGPRAISLKG
jgi:hypothetical protein